MTFLDLKSFLTKKMRMSEIYQPAVIRMLLKNNGQASLKEIAEFIAPLDQEIVNYYISKLKIFPKEVLKKHGIAEIKPKTNAFTAVGDFTYSEEEKAELISICDQKIREWLEKNASLEEEYAGLGAFATTYLQTTDTALCAGLHLKTALNWISTILFPVMPVDRTTFTTYKFFAIAATAAKEMQ
jgi:hypothetical protein